MWASLWLFQRDGKEEVFSFCKKASISVQSCFLSKKKKKKKKPALKGLIAQPEIFLKVGEPMYYLCYLYYTSYYRVIQP